tara:strand:+ start:125 stop:322 length:198 start_codon:yes stop_codon:yes gene_type:complete
MIFQSCHCNLKEENQQCQGIQTDYVHFVKNLSLFVNKAGKITNFKHKNTQITSSARESRCHILAK